MTEIVKFVNTIIVEGAVTSETIVGSKTSQTLVSGVQGPPGATGAAGPQGIPGPTGPTTPGAALVNLANSVETPLNLTTGQALYNYAAGTSTDRGDRLFIGVPSGSGVTGVLVGGKYYTDLLDTATSLASANMLVKRDGTGKLTGDITGNSATASKLSTARNISLTGDVAASAVNFDGTANIQLTASLTTQAGLVAGSYGSNTLTPVITVNNKGVITSISTLNTVANILLAADNATSGIVLTGSTLTLLGGTGVSTAASDNTITIGVNNTVTLNSATQTLTNKTISTNSTWAGNTIGLTRGGTGSTTGSIVTASDLTFSSAGTLNLVASIINIGGSVLTNLPVPQNDSDAVTKSYADAIAQSLDIKLSVKAATTANIVLFGQQSIDGVSVLADDRVLVKNQTNSAENGIWVADNQNWYRASDANSASKVTAGLFTFVEQGTQNAGNGFVLTTSNPIVLDTTNLTFSQFSGGGAIVAGSGLTKTGNTISANFSGSYTDLSNKPTIPAAYILPTASTTTLGGVKVDGTTITITDGVISSGQVSALDHQTYTATAAQTTFAVTYTAPYVNVFVNGVRLSPADYTATNGSSVVLSAACAANDIVDLIGFKSLSIGYGLPSLTGNSGKYLTTDGTTLSWGSVAAGTAAASTLTGTTLASNVTASSLTSLGTIATGVWNGSSISTTYTDAKVISVNGNTGAVTGLATETYVTTALSGKVNTSALATVATSGSYTDLTNRFTGYDHEIHVSQVDGNDTTGNGDLLNPVATITKALTLITGDRRTVIVHPGTYTENPSITVQYTALTGPGAIGGNVLINGTVTANKGCTISGLKMTNLTSTAPATTGNVNVLNCDISGTLTKSGTSDYTLIRFCDIGTTNITGSAGLVAIFGGNPNFITINNAGARVIVKNAVTVAPVLTAGNANFVDSILPALAAQWVSGTTYAVGTYVFNLGFTYLRIIAGAGTTAPASDTANWLVQTPFNGIDTRNAITTAPGTIVTLANSQFIVPTFNNVARVSLSGFYSIFNCVYDKPNSTLAALSASGGSTNSVDYFQYINADRLILATGGQITFPDGSVQNTAGGSSVTNLDSLTDVAITTPSAGQVLKYNGTNWTNDVDATSGGAGAGSVTSTSVVTANGFAGTVATASSTPAITITTSVTGVIKGNGTGVLAAISGTDYAPGTSTLTTGIVKNTTTTGALTIAVAGTDYQAPIGTISGLVKGNGANALTAAVAGTDYQAPLPTQSGQTGKYLTTDGTSLSWGTVTSGVGTVTSVSVVSANGFAGTVATATSTPAITITTSVTGLLKGNATAISAAVAGTDYQAPIGTISGLVKGNGANALTAAVAGTDYQSAQSVNGIVKSSGTTRSAAVAGTDYQAPITLTTTGSSGAATFNGTALNIPQYATGATAFSGLSDASSAALTVDEIYLQATTRLVVTTPVFNYNIDQYSGDNPAIYAISGTTISFNLQVSGSHPFLLQQNNSNITTANLIHVSTSGVVSTGSSAQGKTSGTLYWKIPASVSGTFRYICQNHSSMVGVITIKDVPAAQVQTDWNETTGLGAILNKPSLQLTSEKNAANGYVGLDSSSKISTTYLPSYVDDVVEAANQAALPATGETGKIYVTLDTNKTYRWSGSAYVYITSGAVDSVAGKTGVVTLTSTDVGLGNVTNESKATMFSSPTFTGTVSGVTATHVGLGNVTNESKATMFSSPTFTGTVSGVTATHVGLGNVTNNQQLVYTQTLAVTGDATASATALNTGTIALTLATITDSGTGTFKKITVNSKGLVTGTASVAQADITGLLGASSITNTMLANNSVTIGSTAVSLGATVTTLAGVTLTSPTINSATSNNLTLTGTVTAGGGVGTSGQVLTSTSTGVQWTTVSGGSGGSMTYPAGTGIAVVSGGASWGTTLTAPSGVIVGTTDTQELTNKRVTPRVNTPAVAGTYEINTDSFDMVVVTGQTVNITSITTTGSPTNGQKLWFSVTGTATRTILFNSANFESSTVTLPTTTVGTARLDVGFVWNVATTKWRCVAAA